MMTDLKSFRDEIDSIDRELVRLLDQRACIARRIGASKAESERSTFDPGRAKNVVLQAVARSDGSFPREGLLYVMREVISACLTLQKPLRVGFLGPAATFTHQAAVREFGSSVQFDSFELIRDVFVAVENGWVDFGIVPVENSSGGMVHDTLDAFIDFEKCLVCSEVLLPIHHVLASNYALEDIRRVYSNPQPFIQCQAWLKEHLPHAELVEVASTAKGMKDAKGEQFAAAIGSEFAAEEYGLRVVARRIEDDAENTTRFLVLSHHDSSPCGDDKTSMMFSVKDKPGALFEILRPFADCKMNLSKIESRPTKKRGWDYAFFLDAETHRSNPMLQEAIERARPYCAYVRVLGSYPREKTPREIEELHAREGARVENGHA
jgi:chorismate mutase/prephenate dehydratase